MREWDTSSTLILENWSFTSLTLSFKLASSKLLMTLYFLQQRWEMRSVIEVKIKLLSSITINYQITTWVVVKNIILKIEEVIIYFIIIAIIIDTKITDDLLCLPFY